MSQHVAHRASDEINSLRTEADALRARVATLEEQVLRESALALEGMNQYRARVAELEAFHSKERQNGHGLWKKAIEYRDRAERAEDALAKAWKVLERISASGIGNHGARLAEAFLERRTPAERTQSSDE